MLVEKKRLIELLNHDDHRIKEAALDALGNFFTGSDDVIVHLLKFAADYEHDLDFAIKVLSKMKHFVPTDDDVKEFLRLYLKAVNNDSDWDPSLEFQWEDNLCGFPFHCLEKNYHMISQDELLLDLFDVSEKWEQFKGREPEELLKELTGICQKYEDEEMVDEDYFYCLAFVEALSKNQKNEKIKEQVLTCLSQMTDVNYHLENFLVKLAGNLRWREAIPHLFRILKECDGFEHVHSSCIISLGKIGTPEVVKEIGILYDAYPDLKISFVGILKYIPYEYSEEMALRLLQNETETAEITFLSEALCSIFSIKGGEMILDIISTKNYDPIITWLLDDLVPVYAYHNKTIDNLWKFEKEDRKFREEAWEKSSIGCLLKECQNCIIQNAQIDCEQNHSWEREKVMPRYRIPSRKKNKKKR
ncbi:MAG: armadillo/beta-catenin-like repeat-containing protein [Acidobacteria bacterium]|jgi:hypothetical protein|nr:armadillo/beta-catenin-like repeat-containing protein [Acidobacteriota bacterium]